MTYDEAAETLRTTTRNIYTLVARGDLHRPAALGRKAVVTRESVEALVRR